MGASKAPATQSEGGRVKLTSYMYRGMDIGTYKLSIGTPRVALIWGGGEFSLWSSVLSFLVDWIG